MSIEMLLESEIAEISGGLGPPGAIAGAVGGLAMYGGVHFFNNRPMTWGGAAWAAGTGAAIGASGGMLMAASGGGFAAQLAWRPGMLGLGFGAGQVSRGKGW